jgi:hypothetical protein
VDVFDAADPEAAISWEEMEHLSRTSGGLENLFANKRAMSQLTEQLKVCWMLFAKETLLSA